MIYINGVKATKKDIKILIKHLKEKRTTATAHTTKNGNFAIITSC